MSEIRLKFMYEHGSADRHLLDLYDGAVSLGGIARAMTLATHALVNGEIRTRGDAAHGAKFYLRPAQPGSFVFEALISMAAVVCTSAVFYNFIKQAFQAAVGGPDNASELPPAVQKRIEPTLDELSTVLEPSLIDVHRPIYQAPEMTLKVMRPRGEVLVVFDQHTHAYLQPKTVTVHHPVAGNVTRYNTNSRWGRFYDKAAGRTVSFFLSEDISERERSLVTWSLHESNLLREGTLYFSATANVTPTNRVKRYDVTHVHEKPP